MQRGFASGVSGSGAMPIPAQSSPLPLTPLEDSLRARLINL